MTRPADLRTGSPRAGLSRRFGIYFLGVAIGLVLLGFLGTLKQMMVSPPPRAPAGQTEPGR